MSEGLFVQYRTNNSGGSWWLTDDDWKRLEEAGWTVDWGDTYFCNSKFSFTQPPDSAELCDPGVECSGHRKYDTWQEADRDRWMGALAVSAHKRVSSLADALKEFETVTGQSATDDGCNCCGAPHSFNWGECIDRCDCEGPHEDYNYASGDGLSEYLFDADLAMLSKRELLERMGQQG